MPSKLSRFWQELKRRKVLRVITVYAAVGFVILQLVEILAPSLRLPDWTMNFILVLLIVGFIIAVILSWIYDVKPEGGLEKTKPAKKAEVDEKPTASSSWKIASYISFGVIIVLIIINIIPRSSISNELAILEKSIAVLPFNNLSEEKGNEHFVDGLVEDLLTRISVIEELRVISRTSSDLFRERGAKSVPEIANELGASYIVEGSVQRYGDKARISVQLIDAINDDHLWAENYDRDIVDIFKTQSEIAIQIASELNTILTSKQRTNILENKTKNVKAFEHYQMGRFYWNKRIGDGYTTSIEYFQKAIEEDPGYGLAYAGLADTYYLMALQGWIEQQEGRDKAVRLASKALELDENLAEAYAVLGSVHDYFDWDWENAEIAFQRALELNPSYSTAHQYYSEHLSIIGKHEEAREHIDKAIKLNPLSFIIRHLSTKLYYHQGHFNEAQEELLKCNELQENHPWLPRRELEINWQLGEKGKAYEALWKLLKRNSMYDLEMAENIYKDSGLRSVIEWKMRIDEADDKNNPISIASTYGMIGEDEKAMEWLERAYLSKKMGTQSSFNIHFKNLHDNPRYIAILKGMGLED